MVELSDEAIELGFQGLEGSLSKGTRNPVSLHAGGYRLGAIISGYWLVFPEAQELLRAETDFSQVVGSPLGSRAASTCFVASLVTGAREIRHSGCRGSINLGLAVCAGEQVRGMINTAFAVLQDWGRVHGLSRR